MRLALVQADLHAALEAGVHDPVDHEERAPDAADFAQTRRAFVLARIGGELFQDLARRNGACGDAGRDAQDVGQLRAMSTLLILAPISGRTLSAPLAGVLSG